MPGKDHPYIGSEIDLAFAQAMKLGSDGSVGKDAVPDDSITVDGATIKESTSQPVRAEDGSGVPEPADDEQTVPVLVGNVPAGEIAQSLTESNPTDSGSGEFAGEIPPGVREHMHAVIACKHPDLTPENLGLGYKDMIRLMGLTGIINPDGTPKETDDVPVPSSEAVKRAFSSEALGFASNFQKPVLLLIPQSENPAMSVASKISILKREIARRKDKKLQAVNVHPTLYMSLSRTISYKITGWKISIVEGAPSIKADVEDIGKDLDRRIENRVEQKQPIDAGVDLEKYFMLIIATLEQGGVDIDTITLIAEEFLLNPGQVIQAFRQDDQLYINLASTRPDYIPPIPVPSQSYFRQSVDGALKEEEKEEKVAKK